MKKMLLFLIGMLAVGPTFAKDDFLNFRSTETIYESGGLDGPRFRPRSRNFERISNPWRTKSRLCWIPATVLGGSGGMICLVTMIFNPLSHERNPVRAAEIRKEQRTYMIAGGSLVAASLPLFALAIHFRRQGEQQTVLRFKLEPVDHYYAQPTPIAAVGLSIGL